MKQSYFLDRPSLHRAKPVAFTSNLALTLLQLVEYFASWISEWNEDQLECPASASRIQRKSTQIDTGVRSKPYSAFMFSSSSSPQNRRIWCRNRIKEILSSRREILSSWFYSCCRFVGNWSLRDCLVKIIVTSLAWCRLRDSQCSEIAIPEWISDSSLGGRLGNGSQTDSSVTLNLSVHYTSCVSSKLKTIAADTLPTFSSWLLRASLYVVLDTYKYVHANYWITGYYCRLSYFRFQTIGLIWLEFSWSRHLHCNHAVLDPTSASDHEFRLILSFKLLSMCRNTTRVCTW